ncbi:hypothetical protein KA005_41135, partial [bacterium]|nr:hypothetical protein [bacterium]
KRGINYTLDCNYADSAAQVAWYATLPKDTTLFYAYVVCDTSILYEANKYISSYLDSIDTVVLGDSAINYYLGTTSITKCEQTWDSLYVGITPPLIISYLSEGGAWYDRADASGGSDSTIFKANATGWTSDTWIGDYVWITTGPGIGEAKVIEYVIAEVSGDADTIEVTGTFSTAITSGSDFTVSPESNYTRAGFYDMHAYYGVYVLISDFKVYSREWVNLLDYGGNLNSLPVNSGLAPIQDRTYLSTVTTAGKRVFDYLVKQAE